MSVAVVTFCLNCWAEIGGQGKTCPECGADQQQLSEQSFVDKLIRALQHPEPETPIRAAYILGELKATEAVQELLGVLESSADPYIAAACAQALMAIGNDRAITCLELMLKKEIPLIVRRTITRALYHQL